MTVKIAATDMAPYMAVVSILTLAAAAFEVPELEVPEEELVELDSDWTFAVVGLQVRRPWMTLLFLSVWKGVQENEPDETKYMAPLS